MDAYKNEKGKLRCPGCGHGGRRNISVEIEWPHRPWNIWECRGCGGIYGEIGYLVDSYKVVGGGWCRCHANATTGGMLEETYFDFTGLTSKGMDRRHGWFHKPCGQITQVG